MSNDLLSSLIERGYGVLKGFDEAGYTARVQRLADEVVGAMPPAERDAVRSLGSIGRVERFPGLLDATLDEAICTRLAAHLSCSLAYHYGVVFSKAPGSLPTFWHFDYTGWDEPLAWEATPSHVHVLWYLDRTSADTGCLRVIPFSHRRRHVLHERWAEAVAQQGGNVREFTNRLRAYSPETAWAYSHVDGSVDVPVEPGDVVIIDARLFHGAYPNHGQRERRLLTVSYYCDIGRFSPGFQSRVAGELRRQITPDNQEIFRAKSHLLARATGAPVTARPGVLFPASLDRFENAEHVKISVL